MNAVSEIDICVISLIWSRKKQDIVSKFATKKLESYDSYPCEHPRVTDVTAQDKMDAKIA